MQCFSGLLCWDFSESGGGGVFLRVHTFGERCAVEGNGKYLPMMLVLMM